jgi:Zn-dependent protease
VQAGWPAGLWFGIGLVLLLFVHEMGHVLEARRQGLPVSAPFFIPFLGAAILMKKLPKNAWREALIGIAGGLERGADGEREQEGAGPDGQRRCQSEG